MSARIELRKCTICHKSFGWNGFARCVCNKCKKQSAPGSPQKRGDGDLFIAVNHTIALKTGA